MSQQQKPEWKNKIACSQMKAKTVSFLRRMGNHSFVPSSTGYLGDNFRHTPNPRVAKLPTIEGYVPLNVLTSANLLVTLSNDYASQRLALDYRGLLENMQECLNEDSERFINLMLNDSTKDVLRRVLSYVKLEIIQQVERFIALPTEAGYYSQFMTRDYNYMPGVFLHNRSQGAHLRPFYSYGHASRTFTRTCSMVKADQTGAVENSWGQLCIPEESAIRYLIRIMLMLPIEIPTEDIVFITSREGFSTFVIEDKTLTSLRTLAMNTHHFAPAVYIHGREKLPRFPFPIKVVDQKLEVLTVDLKISNALNTEHALPKALFERKRFVKNLLKTVFNIEATDPEAFKERLEQLQESQRFKGSYTVKEIAAEETPTQGNLITPEELEEISRFLNDVDNSEQGETNFDISTGDDDLYVSSEIVGNEPTAIPFDTNRLYSVNGTFPLRGNPIPTGAVEATVTNQ